MKLEKIIKIAQQHSGGFDLSEFDTSAIKQIGTAENIPIVEIHNTKESDLIMYALKIDQEFVSMVIGKWGVFNGPAFFIQRTYTIPKMRNKGFVTALYKALYTKLRYRMISDVEQSPETISVWKKLALVLPVKAYDPQSSKTYDLTAITDDQLYDPTLDWRLVIEGTWDYTLTSTQPGELNVITELSIPQTTSTILQDYIIYTSDKNASKYQ